MGESRPSQQATLVVLSGRPGSGKTTLARAIADVLRCPLISRDEINEGINHTFGHDPALAGKERVAKLAHDISSKPCGRSCRPASAA